MPLCGLHSSLTFKKYLLCICHHSKSHTTLWPPALHPLHCLHIGSQAALKWPPSAIIPQLGSHVFCTLATRGQGPLSNLLLLPFLHTPHRLPIALGVPEPTHHPPTVLQPECLQGPRRWTRPSLEGPTWQVAFWDRRPGSEGTQDAQVGLLLPPGLLLL